MALMVDSPTKAKRTRKRAYGVKKHTHFKSHHRRVKEGPGPGRPLLHLSVSNLIKDSNELAMSLWCHGYQQVMLDVLEDDACLRDKLVEQMNTQQATVLVVY